jgi:hypothetical protein
MKATMLAKVLHILPRAYLDSLGRSHLGLPFPEQVARQFLEGRLLYSATPKMREEIAHHLHGELCPPCVRNKP